MSPNQSNSNQDISDIDSAYCRATLYSALALGFRPPTEATIARIVEPENAPRWPPPRQ